MAIFDSGDEFSVDLQIAGDSGSDMNDFGFQRVVGCLGRFQMVGNRDPQGFGKPPGFEEFGA